MRLGRDRTPLVERLRGLARRPWRDRRLFVEAYAALGVARFAINVVPFARLAPHLGARAVESPAAVPVAHLAEAERIAWAVELASRYTPWASNCFPQAIAAKYLLHRRGIASTLYLGAAFKARTSLEAHAWLRCGPLVVTGGGRPRFGTLAIFG